MNTLSKDKKKELLFFSFFFLTNLSFLTRGPWRYAVLSVFATIIFFRQKEKNLPHYIIMAHVFVYLVIGFLMVFLNNNISDQSVKQALIYFSSGFVAVNIFHLYGYQNTKKLLDLQLYGICSAYTILYFFFNNTGAIYWETHVFAYILGLFALVYFCQKRYGHMILSLFFLLMEHKRISNLAFLIVLLLLLFYKFLKDPEKRNIFVGLLALFFIIGGILWIYLMSIDFLSETLKLTDRFTSFRMTLWRSSIPHYRFSIFYVGKGIGYVKNWMVHEGLNKLENLHNDFLAAYIELGFVGYFLWLLSFLSVFKFLQGRVKKENLHLGFFFMIYLFINMLTDNTYIYISFMFPFYLMLLSLLFGKDGNVYTSYIN